MHARALQVPWPSVLQLWEALWAHEAQVEESLSLYVVVVLLLHSRGRLLACRCLEDVVQVRCDATFATPNPFPGFGHRGTHGRPGGPHHWPHCIFRMCGAAPWCLLTIIGVINLSIIYCSRHQHYNHALTMYTTL